MRYIDNQLFIKLTTNRKFLDVSPHKMATFYPAAIAFYERAVAVGYALADSPLKGDLLINASFINFSFRESITFV